MTRTDLLSLAERLMRIPVDGGDDWLTTSEAATLLRKLAELRPVAWRFGDGALTSHEDVAARWKRTGLPTAPLYQISEVLTDE